MKLLIVGGARPNFIKMAPLVKACDKFSVNYKIVHTGQHYDFNMSDVFFKDLVIKAPDYNLNVGSASHAAQTAMIMQRFEEVCFNENPTLVVVIGDVNSTLACSIVTSKLKNTKLAHIEAGLRCYDREKPEEINRVVSDVLSDYLFVTVDYAIDNLLKEGILREKIFLVGDTVLDSLIFNLPKIKLNDNSNYVLATFHRVNSTDNPENLKNILVQLEKVAKNTDVVFPIHPRTIAKINLFNLKDYIKRLNIISPLGYLDFLSLMVNSSYVITDSGGIQVEATYLGKPCISVMQSSSHLYTLYKGTNKLADYNTIYDTFTTHNNATPYHDKYADGKASERIVKCLLKY